MMYEAISETLDNRVDMMFEEDQGNISPRTWRNRIIRTIQVAVIKDRGQEGRRPSCSSDRGILQY